MVIAALGLILALGNSSGDATADEPAAREGKQGKKAETKLTATEYKKLIESLANRNEPPKIIGEVPQEHALFKPDYNWDEQKRILGVIATLIEGFEQHWPVLLEFLDDKRYCITFDGDMAVVNYPAGRICEVILMETLTAAHMQHCPPYKEAYSKLYDPDPIQAIDMLKSWGRDQRDKGKPLYEMQIELCEWAIKKIPELEFTPDDAKREAVRKIQSQIKELQMTKKPVLMKGIVLIEFRHPYTPERAAQVRARNKK